MEHRFGATVWGNSSVIRSLTDLKSWILVLDLNCLFWSTVEGADLVPV